MKKSYTGTKSSTDKSKVVIVPRPPAAENTNSAQNPDTIENLGTQGSEANVDPEE